MTQPLQQSGLRLQVPSGSQTVNLFLNSTGDSGWAIVKTITVTVTSNWQRFQLTGTAQNGLSLLYLQVGGGGSVTSGQSISVWGAQMVLGNAAGVYVETSDTTTNPSGGGSENLAANGLYETYAYDAFGDIQESGNYGFVQAYTIANQFVGWNYDKAGNLLMDQFGVGYTWDGESKLSAVTGTAAATYTYDAMGNRVSKSGSVDTIFFNGRPVARLTGGSNWTDLVYGPTGLFAEVPGNQPTNPTYRMTDHLGSVVGTLSATGSLLSSQDYAPFGELFNGSGTNDPYKFTGKERDTESGNDYFEARYYASTMGRFLSPDWSAKVMPVPYAKLDDPQSLNLYSYVRNNPLSRVDKDGHCSAPSVGKGQTGVCIDLYIQAKTINLVGQGDGRGPAANDPKATYREEIQLAIDPKSGSVSIVKSDPGVSKALGGLFSNKGSDETGLSTPTQDKNGTTHFTVNNEALNGLHDLPGAPKDSIKTTINMDVTSEGKVGIEGGVRTAYPSTGDLLL